MDIDKLIRIKLEYNLLVLRYDIAIQYHDAISQSDITISYRNS